MTIRPNPICRNIIRFDRCRIFLITFSALHFADLPQHWSWNPHIQQVAKQMGLRIVVTRQVAWWGPTPISEIKAQFGTQNPSRSPVVNALDSPSYICLVGGIPTPLNNMKVSWDDYSQYMEIKNVLNHQSVAISINLSAYQFKSFSILRALSSLPIHAGRLGRYIYIYIYIYSIIHSDISNFMHSCPYLL